MKKVIIALLTIMTLYSCGSKQYAVFISVYSDYDSEIEIQKYTNNFILEKQIINIPDALDFDFQSRNNKKDDRQFLYKVCRTQNTTNDTIQIYSGSDSFQFSNFDTCEFGNIIYSSQNLNCSTEKEFMDYLKQINNSNYYELLPNQECVTIPIQ